MKVFNYSELHFSELTSFKIHTLTGFECAYLNEFLQADGFPLSDDHSTTFVHPILIGKVFFPFQKLPFSRFVPIPRE